MENPFPYSFNEKRYHTLNYRLKTLYGTKVAKVILDAGFTCPNRDGKRSTGGCIFCSKTGSGDSNRYSKEDLLKQYEANKAVMERKWPGCKTIPYFQSFSNTYGPLQKIREMITPFLSREEVMEIALATRCDCLEDDVLDYLKEVSTVKPLTLELGLQSSNDDTGRKINRAHSFGEFKEALTRLENTGIRVTVHIMNGLPCETKEDMLQTVKDIAHLPFDGIKIHMLHVLKDTALGDIYEHHPFPILSRDDYISLVVEQLRLLPPKIVIERLTGDPVREDLLAPSWVLNKTTILNDIDKLMRKKNVCQGDLYE
ncbi:MAG: TIGR01212 family radical SAM protein [Erysipelotrichaceae bacterium]|nr:TIGR01212 family radical SAM protein [Erysipelotrichaceae bacterium]